MNDAQWYYMRDNHTFRKLTGDEKDFKVALMEEFLDGSTYGMLCTKTEPYEDIKVHAKGKDKWNEFWQEVKEAINTQVVPVEPKTTEDLLSETIAMLVAMDARVKKLEEILDLQSINE